MEGSNLIHAARGKTGYQTHQAFPRTRLTPPRSIIHAVASSVPSNYFQSRGAGPRKRINLIPVQVCMRVHTRGRGVEQRVKRMEEEKEEEERIEEGGEVTMSKKRPSWLS